MTLLTDAVFEPFPNKVFHVFKGGKRCHAGGGYAKTVTGEETTKA
jgi:hypothetical protein